MGKASKYKEDILKFLSEGKTNKEIRKLLNCSNYIILYHSGYDLKDRKKREEGLYENGTSTKNKAKARNRAFVTNYLESHSCVDCGNSDIRVLDFDHVIGEKIDSISIGVKNAWKLTKLIEEIEKCEVRCANCHRIVTHERRNLSK